MEGHRPSSLDAKAGGMQSLRTESKYGFRLWLRSSLFAGLGLGPLLGVEDLVCASSMRPAHLSLIDLRARIPSTSSGSSWSACARDSSSWSSPLASLLASVTASSSSRRSSFSLMPIIGCPPSYNGRVAQHRSRSAWRATPPPAIPCAHPPRAALEGRPVSDRGAETRERSAFPAAAAPTPIPVSSPATNGNPHPMPGGPRRPCPIPCRTPPPLRPETRPGAPWTRRVARRQAAPKGRDTFPGSSPHALRARTTRKTDVGRFL